MEDTALRLAKFFGTSAEFWLGLQAQYDLDVTAEALGERLDREVKTYAQCWQKNPGEWEKGSNSTNSRCPLFLKPALRKRLAIAPFDQRLKQAAPKAD